MGSWGILLLVMGCLWVLQMVGTYFQMRHFRRTLGGITGKGGEGFVGVGNAKSGLGKGVVLILVVGPDGTVRRALRMRGRTVFAKFKETPELMGRSLGDLRDAEKEEPYGKATALAARRAIEQIDRIKAEREGVGLGVA